MRRSTARKLLAAVGVCALIALAVGGLAWAARGLPPPKFVITDDGLAAPQAYPLWRQVSDRLAGRKYLVLTFDDGPYGHGVDGKILSILAKHGAHAVFFEVCAHIKDATANVPSRIVASGNLLGNHTYDHLHLPKLDAAALRHQIAGCSAKLAALTGERPTLFRPPWGQLPAAGRGIVRAAGMRSVLWDANSEDTSLRSPKAIVRTSLFEASLGGRVLLMHSYPATADALDALLTDLQQRGFRFVLPSP